MQAGSPWSVSDAGNVYRLEGNVGIGVDDPDERLVVDGRIKAEEIRLEDVTPADYVFDEDYDLMSLDALKEHIRARGHLPGIAPAHRWKPKASASAGCRPGCWRRWRN